MSDIMERAKQLEEQGYVVVPVHSVGPDRKTCSCPKGMKCGSNAGKHPIGDEWEKRRSGLDFLAELIEKGRRPNLGILPQPSGKVIIDIDPRNGGDVTMAALVKEHGAMPRTKVVKTGSDGWHYYFNAPEGVSLRGKLGPGVDIKHNGMVIAEGSRSWSGEYSVRVDAETCDLPQWIIDEAKKPTYERPEPSPAPTPEVDPDDPDLPRRRNYATSAIKSDLAKLDEMEAGKKDRMEDYKGEPWNNGLFGVACNLFEWANTPEAGLVVEEVVALLVDHSPRDADFGDAEILKTIESARDRVGSTGREIPPPPVDPFGSAPADGGSAPDITPLARMVGRAWKDVPITDAFCEHYAKVLRWVHGLGWLHWDAINGVWAEVDDAYVEGLSGEFAKMLAREAIDSGDSDLRKLANARLNVGPVGAVVKHAKSHPGIRASIEDLNADVELFNCPNGYIDLRSGNLIEHNPDKMMTQVAGCSYRPDATHPDVDEALKALDPDEREWTQMAFGQALLGTPPKEDWLVLLQGVGANGKSAFVSTLLAVVGTYGATVSERVLTMSANAHTTDLTDLFGARVAVLEELPEAGNISGKRLKDISGTEKIKARKMKQDNMTWQASHTLFITTNHRPKITETDHGTWRRPVLLTFPYRFVPTEAAIEGENDRVGDLGLRQRLKLTPQKEAFLAWVVEGAKKYLALGETVMPLTPKMEAEKESWRHDMDPVGRFLDEMVVFDRKSCIPGVDLYEELKIWLGNNGHVPWSSQLATSRLEQHQMVANSNCHRSRVTVGPGVNISPRPGPVDVKYADGQKVRVWTGMRWRTPADDRLSVAS